MAKNKNKRDRTTKGPVSIYGEKKTWRAFQTACRAGKITGEATTASAVIFQFAENVTKNAGK